MNLNDMLISKKNTFLIVFGTIVILFIPLVAMQFTVEVNWNIGDFIVAGALLSFFGYLYKVLTKTSNSRVKNKIIGVIVLTSLIFVWVVLAVDVF
jgi:hypothetical protein